MFISLNLTSFVSSYLIAFGNLRRNNITMKRVLSNQISIFRTKALVPSVRKINSATTFTPSFQLQRERTPSSIVPSIMSIHSQGLRLFASSSAPSTGSDILAAFQSKNKTLEGQNIASALEALANADAVCFDVDSTVIQEEGIDVLAASLGKGEEVAAWTLKAMEGNTKFEDALAARLGIIQPSRAAIEKCLQDTPLQLSPGVDRLIASLSKRGTHVYLVSGGFRIMIEPIAQILSIPKTNIIAYDLV